MNNMTPNDLEPSESSKAIGLVTMSCIALLGGIARQAHQRLSGKQIGWRHLAVRASISLFIGACCYYTFPTDARWAFPACGLLSWMGADGVSLLLQLFFKGSKGGDDK